VKKVVIFLLCIFVAVGAFGQAIDLSEIELSDLDLTRADLSEARLYLAGPVDLLIRGVKYMGAEYAALLQYDGLSTVEIAIPSNPSAAVPYALDLSEVRFSLVSDGIRISNVIADGRYFSGKLVPTADLNLAVSPDITIGGLAGTADLTDDVVALRNEVGELRSQLADAESAKDSAEDQLSDARAQVSSLESRIRTAGSGPADPLAPVSTVTRTVKSGFGGGGVLDGSWSLSGSSLRQSGADQLYSKYSLPVNQNANELVYTFEGAGSASGWSGYGIHFLASGSTDGDLYGFGSSYLVWVTRDPGNTQSDQTFIQLYRSFDDVHMVQVASRAISRSISSPIDITVYVNRSEGAIVLGVDDEAVITFEDSRIIRSGSQVIARALGPASLSGLSVKSR